MRFIKNKTVIMILCLILAAVISFVILPRLYANKSNTTNVYRAARMLEAGTQLTENDLELAEVGAYGLPANLVSDKKQLVGKYLNMDVAQGDYFLQEKLGMESALTPLTTALTDGKKLMAITIPSQAAGAAGHIQKGDLISIAFFLPAQEVVSIDGVKSSPMQIVNYPELKNLEVFSVENDKGMNVEEANQEENSDTAPKTISLLVTDEQAAKLMEAEYRGKLHISIEKRRQ